MTEEKKYTREQIVGFNENDWVFRRSSGYVGYDHVNHPNNEKEWIYERDYSERKRLKSQYEYEYRLISDFRRDQLPFDNPDYHIQEFLDNKFFKNK